jgi:hypothetical protein
MREPASTKEEDKVSMVVFGISGEYLWYFRRDAANRLKYLSGGCVYMIPITFASKVALLCGLFRHKEFVYCVSGPSNGMGSAPNS